MKKLYTSLAVFTLLLVAGVDVLAQNYCTPRFTRNWTSMSSFQTTGGIQDVNVGSLTRTNGNNGYTDATNLATLIVAPSSTVQFTFTYDWINGSAYDRMWIDWNQNGTFDAAERLITSPRYGRGSRTSTTYSVTMPDASGMVPGSTRLRARTEESTNTNPCYNGSWGGSVVDIEVFVPQNSSTISEVISPGNPVCPGVLFQDLTIKVCNDGIARLDTFQVGGLYRTTDAIGNPIPEITMPNITYVDSLAPGECRDVLVYQHSPGFKTGDTIIIWSSMPNGVVDSVDNRDTIMYIIDPYLATKRFSVGDTTAGANDFSSLNIALNYFDSIGGLCDSLIIELDTSYSGTVDQYAIPNLSGAGSNAPIIIRNKVPETQITLRYDSADVDNNYVMLVGDVSYVFFENINFYTADGFATNHGQNILISDESNNIHFIHCNFENEFFNNTNRNNNSLVRGTDVGSTITFSDCNFTNGSDAIYFQSGSEIMISDAKIIDATLVGIHLNNCTNISVSNSEIKSLTNNSYAFTNINLIGMGMWFVNPRGDFFIDNNLVGASNSQWPRYGVFINNYSKISGVGNIQNNVINIGQPWSSLAIRGLYLNQSSALNIQHNSIAVNGNSNANSSLFISGGSGNKLFNNIFSIEVAGEAMTQSTLGVAQSDYNNYYSFGNDIISIGGTGYANITGFRNASSYGMNSYNLNPFFYDTKRNDLHVCNNLLSRGGTAFSSVSSDIDGDSRDMVTPSIGADEFTPISEVRLVDDYGLCPGDTTRLSAGGGNFGETAIWKSIATGSTIDTNQWIDVTVPGEFAVTFFNTCGVVVDTVEIIAPEAANLPSDTNLCDGAVYSVDASITNGTSYMWSTNDTGNAIVIDKQATYFITTTDVWGCISSDQFDVTYSPAAGIVEVDEEICDRDFIQLNSNVSNTIGATFTWTGYDGSVSETNSVAAFLGSDLPVGGGKVKVLVNHLGCITEDSVQYSVLGTPSIQISDTTNGLLFKVVSNTSAGNNHSWDFGDGDTSGFRSPKHIYSANGTYEVKYTNSNKCKTADTTFEVTVLTLDVELNSKEGRLTLFPNPNNGSFNLEFNDMNAENVTISVTDLNGRTVFTENIGTISTNTNHNVNIENIASGYYNINIDIDGAISTERFIVK